MRQMGSTGRVRETVDIPLSHPIYQSGSLRILPDNNSQNQNLAKGISMQKVTKTHVMALALASTFVASSALAAPRTQSSTCSAMKSKVKRNGTLIRKFRGRDTRYVYHSGYCDHGTTLEWNIVKAKDGRCSLKACEEVLYRSHR